MNERIITGHINVWMWHITMVIFLQTLIVSIILKAYIWTAVIFLVMLFSEAMAWKRKEELENEI